MSDSNSFPISEIQAKYYHEMYATIVWFARGKIADNNYERKKADWLDARRLVGFKISDELLNGCKNGVCYPLPEYSLVYLSSISLHEFKEIKSYLMWERVRNRVELSESEQKAVYLDACTEIESHKINCQCHSEGQIPKDIREYLAKNRKNNYENIIRRKAFWNGIYENNTNSDYNWNKAKEIVDAIYRPLESTESLTKKQIIDIVSLIDENHHLTNMFEYLIRCYLFRHKGLTRIPDKAQRSTIHCAKTGDTIQQFAA